MTRLSALAYRLFTPAHNADYYNSYDVRAYDHFYVGVSSVIVALGLMLDANRQQHAVIATIGKLSVAAGLLLLGYGMNMLLSVRGRSHYQPKALFLSRHSAQMLALFCATATTLALIAGDVRTTVLGSAVCWLALAAFNLRPSRDASTYIPKFYAKPTAWRRRIWDTLYKLFTPRRSRAQGYRYATMTDGFNIFCIWLTFPFVTAAMATTSMQARSMTLVIGSMVNLIPFLVLSAFKKRMKTMSDHSSGAVLYAYGVTTLTCALIFAINIGVALALDANPLPVVTVGGMVVAALLGFNYRKTREPMTYTRRTWKHQTSARR